MCGGVRFTYAPAMEPMLAEVYSQEQLGQIKASGTVQSLFWQPRPILPVLLDGAVQVFDWGNRDDKLKLPKTGWVRAESLDAGKWDYLRPQEIVIPVFQGVEKKIWFEIAHGIRGYVVRRGDQQRVYMLTVAPTDEYRNLTGHDRMPALVEQTHVVPLPDESQQQALGL